MTAYSGDNLPLPPTLAPTDLADTAREKCKPKILSFTEPFLMSALPGALGASAIAAGTSHTPTYTAAIVGGLWFSAAAASYDRCSPPALPAFLTGTAAAAVPALHTASQSTCAAGVATALLIGTYIAAETSAQKNPDMKPARACFAAVAGSSLAMLACKAAISIATNLHPPVEQPQPPLVAPYIISTGP